ncbi:hypothetical protein POWCR01_000220000 [Plasmodium ovale]|uniref:PIR protein n=1 Tax=Plasmodium ovale TaxID=36330 RepID=A0A1C3KKI1_PLAOA|nr:hypothetical protein POWCR01_000220000 [Plasmodium ovale]
MSSSLDNFTYDNFKSDNNILENLVFDKIYKKFNDEYKVDDTAIKNCSEIKNGLEIPYTNEDLILDFCKVLYKLIAKENGWQNDDDDEIHEDNKMYCLHLKYWLYEKVATDSEKGLDIKRNFQNWKDKLENHIGGKLKYPCTFNELSWNDISKIRSIYAFILIYYRNLQAFNKNKQIKCKYMDYLGKGLKEYHESINICSRKNEQDKYCKEFKEFQEIYNEDNLNWETSKENTKYIYEEEDTVQCALEIESHNNPLHLTYWYDKKKLHLRNQHIGFQKSTIISTSSAIGTTVGVTAFLLYLYKYTSFRSLFGNRNQQDDITFDNMDAETHNFTLPTSEIGNTHFENNDYNIAYMSLNNY